jgi:DNA-binding Lrp family transcriptional regulator
LPPSGKEAGGGRPDRRLPRRPRAKSYRARLFYFIAVKIREHANEKALAFEREIKAMPEVIACHLVSGEADYHLEVVVPDLEHYQQFLGGKITGAADCSRCAQQHRDSDFEGKRRLAARTS